MSTILIKNATIINENKREIGDVLINKNRIERIAVSYTHLPLPTNREV